MPSRNQGITMILLDFSPATLIICVITFMLGYSWLKQLVSSHLPPGPSAFPLIGCLPFLERKAERTFGKWAKKYGPVITVQLGWNRTVVLNSYEAVVQAFVKQSSNFIGRQRNAFTDFVSEDGHGIIFIPNHEIWKVQRRFGSRALSGSGLGGKSLEARILEEAEVLCDALSSHAGKPFEMKIVLTNAVVRVIEKLTSGGIGDEMGVIKHLVKVVDKVHSDGFLYYVLAILPWSRFFPPVRSFYKRLKRGREEANERYGKVIEEHEKTIDPDHPRDFIDLFLLEMKQDKPSFTKKQLIVYVKELYGAGTETSATTLRWIFRYLVVHPDVQAKLHEEIDRVLGANGKVCLSSDLPYTKAVIQETFRISPVAPLGLPHYTTEDVSFMGYRVPKDTQVFSNIWHIHHDPAIWPEPDKFDPGRHVDNDGKFVKSEKIIPFSVGPRNCLGENLARAEIFLFLVSILQKFEICPHPDNPHPQLEGCTGMVYSPEDYELIVKER